MSDRVSQEFYCGHCDGYFFVRLNAALKYEVLIVCPNCGHEHQRVINKGVISEKGRFQNEVKEKIRSTKATYSKTSRTGLEKYARDGKIFDRMATNFGNENPRALEEAWANAKGK
jgi:uncharacterized Zn finger protein (UPF0148 family)